MNWHALAGTADGNSYRVVYHIPIPAANNRVGISYRTALVGSGIGGVTQLPDGDGTGGTISATEKTAIAAGQVYEYAEDQPTDPTKTLNQLKTILDARFTALADTSAVGALIPFLQNRLAYYGGTSLT